jgi:MEMO1 family protein
MMPERPEFLPDREAVVAGRFYPATAQELKNEIADYVDQSGKLHSFSLPSDSELIALIVPHAGYVFSGTVAASGFQLIKRLKNKKRVFLIGSSHHSFYEGASVYYNGHYKTPLGSIEIDSEVANSLLVDCTVFNYFPEAHKPEHSLEVQLPFLQTLLPVNFKIIPILIGSQSAEASEKIAQVLQPYLLDPENLFIISTDLSHYPSYNDAVKTDKLTVEALCSNSPSKFLSQIKTNTAKGIHNLSTSICGWTSVLTLLFMTKDAERISYHPILYQNSGDIPVYGEKSRVVGYQSIAVIRRKSDNEKEFSLSKTEKEALLTIARNAIANKVKGNKSENIQNPDFPESFKLPLGAFVSIYIDDDLRGCIGHLSTSEPLYKTVIEMALAAATRDIRFAPVHQEELEKMNIEISVLTPLKPVSSADEIIPGKHGVYIKKDFHSGTFLPQVAERTGWDAEQLLSECSERKAGLGRNGWKDAEIYTYEAVVFSEK